MTQNNPYDDPNFVGPVQQNQGASAGQQAIAAAAGVLPGLIARLNSGGSNSNVPPELQQLLAQQVARNNYQNPLFQAVTNQAFMGLPTYARDGLSLGTLGPAVVTPMSGGGAGFGAGAAAGGVGGLLLSSLLTNSGRLAPWAAHAIHSLLGGGATDANTFVGPLQESASQTSGSGLDFGSGGGNGSGGSGGGSGSGSYTPMPRANEVYNFQPVWDPGNPNAGAFNPLVGAFGGEQQNFATSWRPRVQAR